MGTIFGCIDIKLQFCFFLSPFGMKEVIKLRNALTTSGNMCYFLSFLCFVRFQMGKTVKRRREPQCNHTHTAQHDTHIFFIAYSYCHRRVSYHKGKATYNFVVSFFSFGRGAEEHSSFHSKQRETYLFFFLFEFDMNGTFIEIVYCFVEIYSAQWTAATAILLLTMEIVYENSEFNNRKYTYDVSTFRLGIGPENRATARTHIVLILSFINTSNV